MNNSPPGPSRDPAIFEAFYRETVHDVERFIARRVTDPHVVADLTADCFVAAIEHLDTYQPHRGSPRAWIFGIARHVLQDHQRGQATHLRAVTRLAGRPPLDPSSEDDLVARIDAETQARHHLRRIRTLPTAERELLELIAVDDLTLAEASQMLGIRPATARVRLHRARRHLTTFPREAIPCPSH